MHSQRLILRLCKMNPFAEYRSGCSCRPARQKDLEVAYDNLTKSESNSLLKKHLTLCMFAKLKRRTTPKFKSTLLDCIRGGLCQLDDPVGVCAPDPEAYTTFAELFNPIIEDVQKGYKITNNHPESCFGYGLDFPNVDPEGRFIISTRVRCSRSLQNYPFGPRLSPCNYVRVEDAVRTALFKLCNEHYGEYHRLCGMNNKTKKELFCAKLLFLRGSKFRKAANSVSHWPLGRGVFLNTDRTFVVWINDEDHIRVISMQKGGDLGQVYERLIVGMEALQAKLPFWHDKRLGYLNFSPTNLGTSLHVSVYMKLPHLGNDVDKLKQFVGTLGLQVNGTDVKDIYAITNKRWMGLTEYQILTEMYRGLRALVDIECSPKKK